MIGDLLVCERSRRKRVLPGLGHELVDDPLGILLDELMEGERHDRERECVMVLLQRVVGRSTLRTILFEMDSGHDS